MMKTFNSHILAVQSLLMATLLRLAMVAAAEVELHWPLASVGMMFAAAEVALHSSLARLAMVVAAAEVELH
jgi:hypothetical protein